MKSYSKIIPIDLYKRGVMIFFGSKEDLYKKAGAIITPDIRQSLEECDFNHTQAVTIRTETDAIIYAPQRPYDEIIAHEICHATFQILRIVDIDPTECEEAYTYLFEYLYYKIFLWLNALDDAHKS